MFVVVRTTVVERVLEVDQKFIDFGELAVGEAKVVPLRVTNHALSSNGGSNGGNGSGNGDDDYGDLNGGGGSGGGGRGGGGGSGGVVLEAEGLNPTGAFSVLNALRPVKANGGYITVLLSFAPECQGLRQDSLTLHAKALGLNLRVAVRGEGVSPALSMNPANGLLDLGHCLAMDSSEKVVTLHNDSVFPLTFKLVPLDAPRPNFSNQAPFTLVPSEAEVPPGEDLKVSVLFRPDHERTWPFHQSLKVDVPNQIRENVLHLTGRSHARQLYVTTGDGDEGDAATQQPENREDPLLTRPAAQAALLSGGGGGGGGGGNGGGGDMLFGFGEHAPDQPCIKLTFPRNQAKPGSNTRSVTVGCIAVNNEQAFNAASGASSGSSSVTSGGGFELEWPSQQSAARQYFAADVSKGDVAPGKTATVTFTFTPPVIEETYGLDVGQWARTEVHVRLVGGFSHAHANQDEPVKVLLEGYIQI